MLDHLLLCTTSGLVLFYKDYTCPSSSEQSTNSKLSSSLKSHINEIIQSHIITGSLSSHTSRVNANGSSSSSSTIDQGKCFKWALDAKLLVLGIHSVAFSSSFSYLDKALERIKTEFIKKYYNTAGIGKGGVKKVASAVEGRGEASPSHWNLGLIKERNVAQDVQLIIAAFASVVSSSQPSGPASSTAPKAPRSFQQTQKFASTLEGSKVAHQNSNGVTDAVTEKVDQLLLSQDKKQRQPRPFQQKGAKGGKQNEEKGGKKKKEGRSWDASGAATTSSPHATSSALDFSSSSNGNSKDDHDDNSLVSENMRGSGFTTDKDGVVTALDISTLNNSQETPDSSSQPSSSSIMNMFSSFSLTTKPLTAHDLDKPLTKIKEHLVGKNVAAPVASHLSKSLETALLGQTFSKWGGIDAAIHQELSKILLKILSPGESTNILHQIASKKESGPAQQVYSICFVGVNGVGKSTNLSKIAFWLLQNGLSVLVAACDTFRSGAVEQLKVHERNLNALCETGRKVKVFDRGYGKDPAGIAKEALGYAKSEGYDVCLIDTAGRMQDNEPLMRALAKLVTVNMPDKIVFVGEALVGNEAVDQLTKFNQALQNFSGVAKPRQIDGIVLSKFDTIDDKVGAALSMTFVTGKPILFVGTGQTYTDLRRMNVSTIVSTLLKK